MCSDEKIMPAHYKCIGCGLVRKNVEAGGIYYCPNPACTASGASCHKTNFKSYKNDNGTGYFCMDELIRHVNRIFFIDDSSNDDELAIFADLSLAMSWGNDKYKEEKFYYIQTGLNSGDFIQNVIFLKKDNDVTCNIEQASIFSDEDANEILQKHPNYIKLEQKIVDLISVPMIDVSLLSRVV